MNFYKKLLFIGLFISSPLLAQFEMPELSDDDLSALQQDVAAIDEFIKSLPPEEQRKIEEEAFRILSEMPEEDLEQFMQLSEQITEGMPIPEEAPIQEAPAKEAPVEEKVDMRAQEQEKQKKRELRKTISAIIEHIDSLISKTQSMPRISDRPNVEKRWKDQLNVIEEFRALLEHLINPVSGDKDILINKLILDENSGYRTELKQIKSTLARVVPTIQLPDAMGIKKADHKALRSLNQLISDVENLSIGSIADKTRELIKKYAPKELPKETKGARAAQDSTRASRDYSGDSDYGRPSYGGRGYGGDYPDYYGGAGSYPDDFYVPPAQRSADAGRYVQRSPGTGGRSRAGRRGSRQAAQPRTGKPAKATLPKRTVKASPGVSGIPSQATTNPELAKKYKKYLSESKDLQEEAFAPIGQDKDFTILTLGQYLTQNTPSSNTIKNDVSIRLGNLSTLTASTAKKLKELNKGVKKAVPKEYKQYMAANKTEFQESDLFKALDAITTLKSDQIAPAKQAHKDDLEDLQKAWKKLKIAFGVKEPTKAQKPKKQSTAPSA